MMTKISYGGYRFPPEIIQQAIWLKPQAARARATALRPSGGDRCRRLGRSACRQPKSPAGTRAGFVTLAGFTCFYCLPGRARLSDCNALASPRHDRKRPILAQCDNAVMTVPRSLWLMGGRCCNHHVPPNLLPVARQVPCARRRPIPQTAPALLPDRYRQITYDLLPIP